MRTNQGRTTLCAAGFEVVFAQAIPSFAQANVGRAVSGILGRAGIGMNDVDRFICHSGGTKMVTALEHALEIPPAMLDHEHAALRDCGNMSARTVLYVIDLALRSDLPPRSVLRAMGPGFSATSVSLKRAV